MTLFWTLILVAAVLAFILMTSAWAIARRINNYSIIDIAWTYSFLLVLPLYVYFGEGWLPRKLLILTVVSLWSLRLGTFVLLRVVKKHPGEDERYAFLRESFKANVAFNFFKFFQYQAVSIVFLSVPFLLVCMNASPEFNLWEIAGAVCWLVSVVGESVADRQLANFKQNPASKGQVMQSGLWRYSRHPNYFFENMIWWSYFLIACGSPDGFYTIYAPLIMLHFLFNVTGIPFAERQALISRGDLYRDYQRRTSSFVPWFVKK